MDYYPSDEEFRRIEAEGDREIRAEVVEEVNQEIDAMVKRVKKRINNSGIGKLNSVRGGLSTPEVIKLKAAKVNTIDAIERVEHNETAKENAAYIRAILVYWRDFLMSLVGESLNPDEYDLENPDGAFNQGSIFTFPVSGEYFDPGNPDKKREPLVMGEAPFDPETILDSRLSDLEYLYEMARESIDFTIEALKRDRLDEDHLSPLGNFKYQKRYLEEVFFPMAARLEYLVSPNSDSLLSEVPHLQEPMIDEEMTVRDFLASVDTAIDSLERTIGK